MEFGAFDVDGGHLGVGDDNAAGVLASIEFAAHPEAKLDAVCRHPCVDRCEIEIVCRHAGGSARKD